MNLVFWKNIILCELFLFQENKSVEVNTVLEVSKIGYKLKDRCIRPALVGVSK